MKINIEIDVSPEEVRKLYGWPDLSSLPGSLLEQVGESLKNGDADSVGSLLKPYVTESMRAVSAYQNLLMNFVNLAGQSVSPSDKKTN